MPMTDVYTGANGTLVVMGGSDAEGLDAQAVMDLEAFTLFAVGRVTDVQVHVETDLAEFHEIGRRHAASLHPGNIHIRGTVRRAYVNGALLYLLLGRGASPNDVGEPYVQPALAMNVVLDDPAIPGKRGVIDTYDVQFDDWSFRLPEDDFVLEDATFKALRINVRDEEDGETRVPAFPETD